MYTSVCPNRYQVWYTLGQKKKIISIFLKIACYEDILNASYIDALHKAVYYAYLTYKLFKSPKKKKNVPMNTSIPYLFV